MTCVYDGHMTEDGRLSSCDTCGATIEYTVSGWRHVTPQPSARTRIGHTPTPDDSRVDGPDHSDVCDGDCDDCENERAADDDYEMSRER